MKTRLHSALVVSVGLAAAACGSPDVITPGEDTTPGVPGPAPGDDLDAGASSGGGGFVIEFPDADPDAIPRPVTAPAPSTAVCRKPEAPPSPSSVDLIDDFEDGDLVVSNSDGRGGSWWATNDKSSGGTQEPTPFRASEIAGCQGALRYLTTRGSGFRKWGAQMGMLFLHTGSAVKRPYDASKYAGVTFWARSGKGTEKVRVSLVGKDTEASGGVCQENPTGQTAVACNNHFSAELSVGSSWKAYTVLFKDLKQTAGWGKTASAPDLTTTFGLLFTVSETAGSFDLWLDDLAFVRP
jgi:hypothetical protein